MWKELYSSSASFAIDRVVTAVAGFEISKIICVLHLEEKKQTFFILINQLLPLATQACK